MNQFKSITTHERFNFNTLVFYLTDALRLLNEAYIDMLNSGRKYDKKVSELWYDENTIRDDLVELAEDKEKKYTYEFDTESRDLKKKNRVDITVVLPYGLGFNYRIAIECKLLENTSKNNNYITKGISRFITGYYSEKMPLAGMVGFVERGQIQRIIEDINNRLDKKTTAQYLKFVEIIHGVRYTYFSKHMREKNLGNINIYHMLLDFSKLIIMS